MLPSPIPALLNDTSSVLLKGANKKNASIHAFGAVHELSNVARLFPTAVCRGPS